MPANVNPIYTKTPDVASDGGTTNSTTLTSAANDFTGVSANYALNHTAGANGSYVKKLRFKARGSNVATVARIFLNNGSTPGTGSNNRFFGEIALPATSASANNLTGADIDYPMEIAIPNGWRVYVGIATAVAGGWDVTAVAGQY